MPLSTITPAQIVLLRDTCSETISLHQKRAAEARHKGDFRTAAREVQLAEELTRLHELLDRAAKLAQH